MTKSYFITGIDTDSGKSIVTGVIGRWMMDNGIDVITQKMAQTGCVDTSEDILTHRRLMRCKPFPEDITKITCPYIFPFPAAPSLSARLVNQAIEPEKIFAATDLLTKKYECVLVEGVGGVMVPLTDKMNVVEYLVEFPMDTILVTNGKLGSLNHTMLSLEVCKSRGINIVGVVYNDFIATDSIITEDSLLYITNALKRYYPNASIVRFPYWDEEAMMPDFSPLFK